MKRRNDPKKIDAIIENILLPKGYMDLCREGQIRDRWPQIVGEKLATQSECMEIKNGVLYVRVQSASWRQELSYFKQQILEKIRTQTECTTIEDIVFC